MNTFYCKKCNFGTHIASEFLRHIKTKKHYNEGKN